MRPFFSCTNNPARSKTRSYLEMAGSETSKSSAKAVTDESPMDSCSKMERRIGSDNAAKVRSSV